MSTTHLSNQRDYNSIHSSHFLYFALDLFLFASQMYAKLLLKKFAELLKDFDWNDNEFRVEVPQATVGLKFYKYENDFGLTPTELARCAQLGAIDIPDVRHVMSCHVMSCHVMSDHVMSCHVISCQIISCHIMSCHVISCHIMSCHVMSYHVMSYHVISYHVMSYHIMSCHIMSCHVMSAVTANNVHRCAQS